jgi:hypothetical protein
MPHENSVELAPENLRSWRPFIVLSNWHLALS